MKRSQSRHETDLCYFSRISNILDISDIFDITSIETKKERKGRIDKHHFTVNDERGLDHAGINFLDQGWRFLEWIVDDFLDEQRWRVDDDQRDRGSVVAGRYDDHHDYDDGD